MVTARTNPNSRDFENCPEGMFDAVCVDVIDLGIVDTGFKNQQTGEPERKPMVAFGYQVAVVDENDRPQTQSDGQPYYIRARFNNTLGGGSKRSNLLDHLENWTGKTMPEEKKEEGIDLEKFLGVNCQIVVVHRQNKQQRTFANIKTITPARKGAPKLKASPEFVRVKDRPGYEPPVGSEEWEKRNPQAANGGQGAPPVEDEEEDSLPF